MMSKRDSPYLKASLIIGKCANTPYSLLPARRNASGYPATSFALVIESPEAKSVTLCPRRTSSSVRYETTLSVPP